MPDWIRVGRGDRLPCGQSVRVEVEGLVIALHRDTRERLRAIDDECPHAAGSLADGCVVDDIVTCPWHAWRYDLADGSRVDRPGQPIRTYDSEERDGWIWLDIAPMPVATSTQKSKRARDHED